MARRSKRSRRSGSRKSIGSELKRLLKRNPNAIKHLAITSMVLLFLGVPAAFFGFFLSDRADEFACTEGTTPSQKLVVVIDKSEKISSIQRRLFNKLVLPFEGFSKSELIGKIRSKIPAGTQIVIYPIDGRSANSIQPLFDECRRPLKEDFAWYDHFYKGALAANKEFYFEFFNKIQEVLEKNIKGGGRQRSPIMETVQMIQEIEKDTKYPVDLLVFSDLQQHSKPFSFYKLCKLRRYKSEDAPVCPPAALQQPCSVAVNCKQTIQTCVTSICLEENLCGAKPSCGKPSSHCYNKIPGQNLGGKNPMPHCDCWYKIALDEYEKQCNSKMSSCEVKAVTNLKKCQAKRAEAIESCQDDQKATREQCRKEDQNYKQSIQNHKEQCETDLREWRSNQEKNRREYENRVCTWEIKNSFDKYKQEYASHWRRVASSSKSFRNITFVQLQNKSPNSYIPMNWVESFWTGYAEELSAKPVKFYRE